jgi:3-carboxy-cis,cis-muconate cycloisomerase
MSVFDEFLSTPEMLELFGAPSMLQSMLDFEAALARAEAGAGLIPQSAANAIAGACKVELLDAAAIVAASRSAGSLAIPLVKQLTAAVARADAEAARLVHLGSTSQDVIDTAMALATRRALALLERDLDRLIQALFALADAHGDAPLLARTLLQPAQVVSLGFKVANWLAPLLRGRERLRAQAALALQLQLGGAVGTLSVLGEHGPAVARRMADELGLRLPDAAWHTQRDEWVRLGLEVALLTGSLGKIAADLALMAQGEVGELAEPSGGGRGGSSAMPHKRNPVAAMLALAAGQRVPPRVAALLATMAQEHERGLGNWQAELAEWAQLFAAAHGGLKALADAAALGLEVDAARMRENIERQHGLVYAEALSARLAATLGKARAHALVEDWSRSVAREGRPLRAVAEAALAADGDGRRLIAAPDWPALFDAGRAADPARRLAAAQLDALRQRWRAAADPQDA